MIRRFSVLGFVVLFEIYKEGEVLKTFKKNRIIEMAAYSAQLRKLAENSDITVTCVWRSSPAHHSASAKGVQNGATSSFTSCDNAHNTLTSLGFSTGDYPPPLPALFRGTLTRALKYWKL